jgi:type II secretory pathway pseudopilin PulG
MYKNIKRYVTLIEMMIVMFLIAMIIGVVAYNYSGSLDEGKAFKTKASIEKIETLLTLEVGDNSSALESISSEWQAILSRNTLVKNADELSRDGWGNLFDVRYDNASNRIIVSSQRFQDYSQRNPNSKFRQDSTENRQ